jgi:methylase of polypeptide subunit release factors
VARPGGDNGAVSTHELPAPGPDVLRLRQSLLAASFTADGLLEQLGAVAYAALARGETVPALRATADGSPLAALTRLFLLRHPVDRRPAERALDVGPLLAAGWLRESDGSLAGAVDIRPYAGPAGQDWWIVSDAGYAVGGAAGAAGARPDVVLGVGGASATLAQLTVDGPVSRALDLGTGCGIQALHLADRAPQVTATDVNPRALRMARLTLALSGLPEPDLREGSLFEPVAADEPYDLIVSNPPLVISPRTAGGPRLTYRDSGMDGDELCRTLVHGAADRLADGGHLQLLANWQHVEGEDWRERVAGWVPPGCDAWIIQREEQDVAEYTELWLRDAGAHRADPAEYAARYDRWLDEFAARRTRAVGFGWITLRRTGAERPSVLIEEWPHAVRQPLGAEIRRHFERQDLLRAAPDTELLERRYVLGEDVVQEQLGRPGEEDPEHVVLRRRGGLMRATTVDTVGAGLAGACDGTLSARRIVDAIAQLLREDPAQLREATPPVLRSLVEQGFLHPAEP